MLKSHSGVSKENEKLTYPCFKSSELPDHHFPTVKDWLNALGNELLAFSESLVKKVKDETAGKPFVSDTFTINDVNNTLINVYNILDSSVEALHGFRGTMCDYISTWKVTLGDALICESSDSSVEIIENNDVCNSMEAVEINESKGDNSVNTEERREPSQKFGGLRIRKPSEVNKLMLEELSNEGSNSLNASNDSSRIEKYQNTVTKNSEKATSTDNEEDIDNTSPRPKSVNDTNTSSSFTNLTESESANNRTETTSSVVEPSSSGTNKSQELVNVNVSEDCIEISSPLKIKETSPPKKKSVINWDTSTESMVSI